MQFDTLALKIHLAKHVLNHVEQIDGRTGSILLRHHVLKPVPNSHVSESVVAMLINPTHPLLLSAPPGPILFHFTDSKATSKSCVQTSLLLLSQDKLARSASLAYFMRIVGVIGHSSPDRLESALNAEKDTFLSDDVDIWTKSAVILFDLVNDDFFLNLSGFKQSVEMNYPEGLNEYFHKIIFPRLPSIQTISLAVSTPSTQHSAMEHIIDVAICGSVSFISAFNDVYVKLGALPLNTALSFSSLLAKWQMTHPPVENLWNSVWAWADAVGSPLARYHAVAFFADNPTLVPSGKTPTLWEEILEILFDSQNDKQSTRWQSAWLLRLELAQHYLKYFANRRPGQSEEAIACFAWWMAEKVAQTFGPRADLIENVRTSALRAACRNSDLSWQASATAVESSSFVFATLYTPSVWSLSIECLLSAHIGELGFDQLPNEMKSRFTRASVGSLYSWFPVQGGPDQIPTFVFGTGTAATCRRLVEIETDPERARRASELVNCVTGVESNEAILLGLQGLLSADNATQMLTVFAFRSRSYLDAIPIDAVWSVLTHENWFQEVLSGLDEGPLQVLFDALNTLQLRGGELWTCNLPHFLALAAEAAHGNRDRQKLLFLFTILSSIRGRTTSAIERLLQGRAKGDFVDDVTLWRGQFARIIRISPPWIASRIRSVMPSLSVH